jgi:cytochrome c556
MRRGEQSWQSWSRVVAGVAVICAGVAGSTAGLAHRGASGIVKERMDVMKSLKADMKEIFDMFRGRTRYSTAIVRRDAVRMTGHALDYERLFPPGSNGQPSEASPRIWSEQTRFGSRWT